MRKPTLAFDRRAVPASRAACRRRPWCTPASADRRSNCRTGVGPAAGHQVDALRLAGVVVVQQQLRLFGENRPTVLVIAVAGAAGGADDLLGWDASSSRPRWA